MAIVIGFLTFVLALISLFLILLVLVQLPKKEAGVGMAFGAGMSEMLLGAGSGNVLTRITKYTVGTFLGLSLVLSVMMSHHWRKAGQGVNRAIEEKASAVPAASATTPTPSPSGSSLQPLTLSNTPAVVSTTVVVNPAPAAAPVSTVVTTAPIQISLPPAAPATPPAAAPTAAPATTPVTPAAPAPAPAAPAKPAGN